MPKTETSQGPWTRIRPLQDNDIDPYAKAGMATAEITWGSGTTSARSWRTYRA
jgi:hypothetical protein